MVRPLDEPALRRIALHYSGRYATTRAKLQAYLLRKISERGWDGACEPPVAALVERFAALGYVDDRAFGEARAAALTRRGYGERRVGDALKAAGIGEEESTAIRESARHQALDAALAFARRRRIGPFAAQKADRDEARRHIAAMMRAGHPLDLARRILAMAPGEAPEPDEAR
jgi:regulatory protein